jgi:glycosyltransferase involved in cell wall biosynthesis
MSEPLVSVIMSVYDEDVNHLSAAIDSIISQSFKDFEFIIVIDNPGNHKLRCAVLYYKDLDRRIRVIINESNIGLAGSLNKALHISVGDYIARMDADDVAWPHRLADQLNYLKYNPDIDLVGCSVRLIDDNSGVIGAMDAPRFDILRPEIVIRYKTVAFHPTWVVTRRMFFKLGGYNNLDAAQDYEFLYRAIRSGFSIGNVSAPLLDYRVRARGVSNLKSLIQLKSKRYVYKLYNKKAISAEFVNREYKDYLQSSAVIKVMHRLSSRAFARYLKSKKLFSKGFWLIVAAMLSPYAFLNYVSLIEYKILYAAVRYKLIGVGRV